LARQSTAVSARRYRDYFPRLEIIAPEA